jgi:hypothetical protein
MVTLSLIEGSQFWAAQLQDERFLPEAKIKLDERKRRDDVRPSLVGYTRLQAAIEDLIDQVHLLRAEQGRWGGGSVSLRKRPKFPADILEDKRISKNRAMVNAALEHAHSLIDRPEVT